MRTPVIAGNWKMYKTVSESVEFVKTLSAEVEKIYGSLNRKPEIVVAPTSLALESANNAAKNSKVIVSAQNCAYEDEGAFTGEISPKHLKASNINYTIIGHSERRQYFAETDETVNKRIKAALKNNLTIIFCVGETLTEREANQTNAVIKRQVTGGLRDIANSSLNSIIIAYEPVWAIGTGKVATPEQAEDAHAYTREVLKEMYGDGFSSKMRILYGGSVKPDNAKGLFSKPNIDGALIGGASLKVDSFVDIMKGL